MNESCQYISQKRETDRDTVNRLERVLHSVITARIILNMRLEAQCSENGGLGTMTLSQVEFASITVDETD